MLYSLLLDRAPSDAELSETLAYDAEGRRDDLIAKIVTIASNKAVVLNKENTALWLKGVATSTEFVWVREPNVVPANFFEVSERRSRRLGIMCFHLDQSKRLTQDPGMQLLGHVTSDGWINTLPEWVFYGPRADIPSGKYIISIDVELGDDCECLFDVVSELGSKTHISLKFKKSLQLTTPLLFVSECRAIELRLLNLSRKAGRVLIKKVALIVDECPNPEDDTYCLDADIPIMPESIAKTSTCENNVNRRNVLTHKHTSYFKTTVFKWIKSCFTKQSASQDSAYNLIKRSGMFDEMWYLQRYPDVAAAKLDPIFHYLKYGAKEGRLPNTTFDPLQYIKDHPEAGTGGKIAFVEFVQTLGSAKRR
jgi:hypothetical protein